MSHDPADVAQAVLHEGYLLYPYRPSALKNLRHRYPFGTLYPEAFCEAQQAGDASAAEVECVAVGPETARLSLRATFLDLADGAARVREVDVAPTALRALASEGRTSSFRLGPLAGEVTISASAAGADRWVVRAALRNRTPIGDPLGATRDEALARSLASAHLLLRAEGADLVSAIDPPPALAELVARCRSVGLWPVLVGPPGSRDAVLAAPIILYDHPELAPESPGDFFDGTEIDELLTLRVLTLTDEEKRAMAEADPRARALLDRTEAGGLERLRELHGRFTGPRGLRPGARVRLRPAGRGDIFDLALAGKEATIQAVERDLEGRVHLAVTVDDDPGKDLGAYGHRFFFRPEEVELL